MANFFGHFLFMTSSYIQQNIISIQEKIRQYELQYNKPLNSVNLLAVTKHQPIENIQQAILAGQTLFGESYLQEALPKIEFFKDQFLEWHFIGPIQSNKTKKIAEHFSWVQSVDSLKIAQRLNDQRPYHLPPLNICLQINVSEELSKSGVFLDEVFALSEHCNALPRLNLRGLMTIPAPSENILQQRAQLHTLKLMFDELKARKFELDILSMGMSNDLEAAIAEGSTMVRIGTALFGLRK